MINLLSLPINLSSNKYVVERTHTNTGNVGDASGATQASLHHKEFLLERDLRNIKDMVNPIIRFQTLKSITESILERKLTYVMNVTNPLPIAQVVENIRKFILGNNLNIVNLLAYLSPVLFHYRQ